MNVLKKIVLGVASAFATLAALAYTQSWAQGFILVIFFIVISFMAVTKTRGEIIPFGMWVGALLNFLV